jgi:putative tryptophan/tyrosine transport system substrate-binding protein
MTRRTIALLVTVALGLLMAPLAAEAQPSVNVPRLGLLSPFSPADTARWHQAFRQGLQDLGWVEGRNISLEYRYAEGRSERLPALAADLVRLQVDIIVAAVTPDALAAQHATTTIPL